MCYCGGPAPQDADPKTLFKEIIVLMNRLLLFGLAAMVAGCGAPSPPPDPPPDLDSGSSGASTAVEEAQLQRLDESWQAYKQRFIQADGRVIDREDGDRTVSEGQAYALLRAVMADDPTTFSIVLSWSESNLGIFTEEGQQHQLWAWKWGRDDADQWGIIDANFASDADLDACVALILAARMWNQPQYLDLARDKLADLWALSTIDTPNRQMLGGGRIFLPGPKEAFQPSLSQVVLNPSYFAPYAFRLFAQVDPDHDWGALVDSSYDILTDSAQISAIGLPSDWVALDLATGDFSPVPPSSRLVSQYGFDAYRVWWRVALDAALTGEPRATAYLNQHLPPLLDWWQETGSIPAEIGLQGEALVEYDSPAQYGMLYPAFSETSPDTAEQILNQALLPTYSRGIWASDTAYYTQNLIGLGLYPSSDLKSLDWRLDGNQQNPASP